MAKTKWNKWLRLIILSLGVGIIFQLPYIRETFYVPLQKALGASDQQMGLLSSGYAMMATISYFLGGILADRFSSRKLIAFSLVTTGILGVYFSTFPGYTISRWIFVLWGITTIITYFPALIKATRNLGDSSEQGRMFGFQEGFRGIANTLLVLAMLAVFKKLGSDVLGVAWAIRLCAIANIIVGILSWALLEDDMPEEDKEELADIFKGLLVVLKNKKVWLITGVIFTTYTAYGLIAYVTPYMINFYGASEELGAALGSARYVIQFAGGILGGILADKIGSRLKVIIGGYIGIIVTYGLYFFIPEGAGTVALIITNFVLGMFVIYVMRSIYFAIIDESGIPEHLTGRASGVITSLGYTPDIFTFAMVGKWMDLYGKKGYHMTFGYAIAIAALGILIASVLFKLNEKEKQEAIN